MPLKFWSYNMTYWFLSKVNDEKGEVVANFKKTSQKKKSGLSFTNWTCCDFVTNMNNFAVAKPKKLVVFVIVVVTILSPVGAALWFSFQSTVSLAMIML